MTAVLERPRPEAVTSPPTERPPPIRRRVALPVISRSLWWATPAGCLMLVVPVSALLAIAIPDRDYRLFYNTPKAITTTQTLLFLAAGGCLVIGALVAQSARYRPTPVNWPTVRPEQARVLSRGATVCFWLTVVGYSLFFLIGAARGATPSVLLHSITSQSDYSGVLKADYAPVAGVTSLTQVGIASVILEALLLDVGSRRLHRRRIFVIVLLSFLRSYFHSERLALLEIVIPLGVIMAMRLRQRRRRGWLAQLMPIAAIPLLVVVFGAFEYSRSWTYFRSRTTLSFPHFVINRLAGYYATSYNNGALQLDYGHSRGLLPYDSIQAVWTSPGLAQLNLYQHFTGTTGGTALNTVLNQHGSPEFNNPGGLAVPIFDWGVAGGLIFFVIAGLVIGLTYRAFRAGDVVGLLFYPVLFTGILELPRYLYWTQGRVVPAYLALLIIGLLARQARPRPKREPSWS